MNADGKSDELIVPMTLANKGRAERSAESGEGSGSTKRNVGQTALSRTQSRIKHKSRGWSGVREDARKASTRKFTAWLHHGKEDGVTEACLKWKKREAVEVEWGAGSG